MSGLHGAQTPSNASFNSGGSSVSASAVQPTYIFYKIGSTYYAQSTNQSYSSYQGANAATVFQSAQNVMTNGGEILFKQGSYPANFHINNPYITLKAESVGSVILNDVAGQPMISLDATAATLLDPKILGFVFSSGGAGGNGISTTFGGSNANYIYRLHIKYCQFFGFSGAAQYQAYLQNIEEAEIIGNRGIIAQATTPAWYFFNNGYDSGNIKFNRNTFFSTVSNATAVLIEPVSANDFVRFEALQNKFTFAGNTGCIAYNLKPTAANIGFFKTKQDHTEGTAQYCYMNGANYVWGGTIDDLGFYQQTAFNGTTAITINGSQTYGMKIINSTFTINAAATTNIGILDTGNNADMIYCNNTFNNFAGAGSVPMSITDYSAGFKKIYNNGGFKTVASGTSTGTSAQQTIPHGLALTPTYNQVFLTERSTGLAIAYQSAVPDATNIYVTATNGKTYN